MEFDSLIQANELVNHLQDPDWVIIDCHFELVDSTAGLKAYQNSHIPGALYAHLNQHLAGPVIDGKTGRHPLPDVEIFTQTLSNWGIDDQVQVVVYDNRGGGIAARLWWMLKWLGHDKAAILDGGLARWKEAGYPLEKEVKKRKARAFKPTPQPDMIANPQDIESNHNSDLLLIDSRAPERYRAENEPIDPVAGHIPGAINAFYMENIAENKTFLPKEKLKEKFSSLIGNRTPSQIVFYCGSGVTAVHNIFAMYYAGLGLGKLYPGSWSEWITDPNRPIVTTATE